MFCCVALSSPACSDGKDRSRRSRNRATKTSGKAERDMEVQATHVRQGACRMKFRSLSQDGNRLESFFTVQFVSICCKQWQVEQAQARQEKVQKERQRLEGAARQGLSHFKLGWKGIRKILRHTFLRTDLSNEVRPAKGGCLLWFQRFQLWGSQIGLQRKGPHDYRSYRQTMTDLPICFHSAPPWCLWQGRSSNSQAVAVALEVTPSRSKERASGSCQHQRTHQALIVGKSWTQKCFFLSWDVIAQAILSLMPCTPLTCAIVTGGGLKLDSGQVHGSQYIESYDLLLKLAAESARANAFAGKPMDVRSCKACKWLPSKPVI